MHKIYIAIFLFCIFTSTKLSAQFDTTTTDGLFEAARQNAFEKKDYDKATEYCHKALLKSPAYTDIRIFLGRIYTWRNMPDSARSSFQQAITDDPYALDAYIAYTNLEYWENNNDEALQICLKGLEISPESPTLLLHKAKILNQLHRYKESVETLRFLLKKDRKNESARSLLENISNFSSKNKISLSYDFEKFDKQFSDPWHLVSLAYSRQTNLGSIAGNINYANRFKKNGIQFELEAYPKINKLFYCYLSGGYSPNDGIFPQYRAGFSLYSNLPKSFEAELGFRYLYFESATWIYTAALGKYYKNWLFGGRIYLTPDTIGTSQSYSLSARYYLKGADDFLGLQIGTGVSPDDRKNNILVSQNLTSYKINGMYKWSVKKQQTFSINIGWENRTYAPATNGNQFNVGAVYAKRF